MLVEWARIKKEKHFDRSLLFLIYFITTGNSFWFTIERKIRRRKKRKKFVDFASFSIFFFLILQSISIIFILYGLYWLSTQSADLFDFAPINTKLIQVCRLIIFSVDAFFSLNNIFLLISQIYRFFFWMCLYLYISLLTACVDKRNALLSKLTVFERINFHYIMSISCQKQYRQIWQSDK